MPEARFEELLATARKGGATEILFLAGEASDSLAHLRSEIAARGFRGFVELVRNACERALEAGLLPHTNIGAMSEHDFERLADVNASMGLMLENIDDAFNRTVAPQKSVRGRLRTLEAAGRARVPYTSGILIGLGESRESRFCSLDALAEIHARHGHLQEIILQNFIPNEGSRLGLGLPVPTVEEYLELIEHWRRVAPGVAVQIPPNINPHWEALLPWIDDLGGISTDGDWVNPLNPWAPPTHYAEACRRHGLELRHRWPVYDSFVETGWISDRVAAVIRQRGDEAQADASANHDLGTATAGKAEGCVGEASAVTPNIAVAVSSPERAPAVSPGPHRSHGPAEPLSKALREEPLSVHEALRLAEADGAAQEEIRDAADVLNRRLHGEQVTYVVNRNANFTNVCTTNCSFCGFYRPPGHPEAYTRSVGAVVERVLQTPWVSEVCLQGGIHPDLGLEYYEELLRALKRALPGIHLHAYSPMEIHSLCRKSGLDAATVLGRLRDAGLGSVPGTAAEILDDAMRDRLSPDKLRAAEWESIIETAHRAGLRSTATVLFGHRETWEDLVRHLDRIRALQRRTGGFTEFVPLAFMPHRNRLGRELAREAGAGPEAIAEAASGRVERLYPLVRLFLGREIPNLQTSWVKLGPERAAAMLRSGCNDFGGTLYEESITRESGGPFGECLTPAQIEAAIRSVGRVPRQRTTLYGVPA
jgi:FO synthase